MTVDSQEAKHVRTGQVNVLGAGKKYGWEYGDQLQLLKDAGFDCTDTEDGIADGRDQWIKRARQEKAHAKRTGLEVVCYHSVLMQREAGVTGNVEVQQPHMECAAEKGARLFLVHALWEDYTCFDLSSQTAWAEQRAFDLQTLGAIAAKSTEFGLRTVVENNPWFPLSYYVELMHGLSEDLCGAILDTGHANLQPEGFSMPVEEAILALAGRIEHLHLHDNDGLADQHLPVLSSQGTLNWPTLFKALKESGYTGVLNEELPPMTGIAWTAWSLFERGAGPLRELWDRA